MSRLPKAVVTVQFEAPVTGLQLAALVQQAVQRESKGQFAFDKRYYDGDIMVFGQSSNLPYNNTRVVPSLNEDDFFRMNGAYYEVKVINSSWGGSDTIDYSDQQVVDAVKAFAAQLKQCYSQALHEGLFPEYVEPQRWAGGFKDLPL